MQTLLKELFLENAHITGGVVSTVEYITQCKRSNSWNDAHSTGSVVTGIKCTVLGK
jgi:hypothetical protein